jgi:hypothetical protein
VAANDRTRRDRLSRSLLDFVRVMERLDAAGVSFVSVCDAVRRRNYISARGDNAFVTGHAEAGLALRTNGRLDLQHLLAGPADMLVGQDLRFRCDGCLMREARA